MGPTETRARLEKLFVVACEQVVRDIFKSDGIGEPSAAIVKTINEKSAEVFSAAFGPVTNELTPDTCEAFALLADNELLAKFAGGMRPQILAALAPVRNS